MSRHTPETGEPLSVKNQVDPNGMFLLFDRWERKGLVSSAAACKRKYTDAKKEVIRARQAARERKEGKEKEDAALAAKQSAAPSEPNDRSANQHPRSDTHHESTE